MERNKILFSGQSNTFGLGLEYEFRPKYNDHEWLTENGMMLPIEERTGEDKYYWKKYNAKGEIFFGKIRKNDNKNYISDHKSIW